VDPVNARRSFRPKRVALLERRAVVDGVGNRDARSDGIAGPEQRPKVGSERDPQRGDDEMVPAAVTASTTVTPDVSGTGFVGAQRARATALSSIIGRRLRRSAKRRSRAGSTVGVAALSVSWQPVVRDRLPACGVVHELANAGTDPGIAVERPHANADWIGVRWIAGEQRGAAIAAKPLLAAALGLPDTQRVLAGNDPERALSGMGVW